MSTVQAKCLLAWLGDGKCNKDNNVKECNYDNGDCCQHTCKLHCKEINAKGEDITAITFAIKRKEDRKCPFECGVLRYDCEEEGSRCVNCNKTNANCLPQPLCFEDYYSDNPYDTVKYMLDYCQALDWSMGNLGTIDTYCGVDPSINITHDANNKSLHFPGCGYYAE